MRYSAQTIIYDLSRLAPDTRKVILKTPKFRKWFSHKPDSMLRLDGSTKVIKGNKLGYRTAILYLVLRQPTCPASTFVHQRNLPHAQKPVSTRPAAAQCEGWQMSRLRKTLFWLQYHSEAIALKTALSDHDATKAAAQHLLRNGLASYAEIASICGRSRQIVRFWAAELDAETARQDHLAKLWRDALRQNKAKQIGDTGQFTNSWLKMNTAPPEFGEAVSPCLAMPCHALPPPWPRLAAPRPLALPCRALSL